MKMEKEILEGENIVRTRKARKLKSHSDVWRRNRKKEGYDDLLRKKNLQS